MSNKRLFPLIIPFAVISSVLRYLSALVPKFNFTWKLLEIAAIVILGAVAILLIVKKPEAIAMPKISNWRYFIVLFVYFYCADRLRNAHVNLPKFGVAWLVLDIALTIFFAYALFSPTFLAKKKK